MNHGFLAEGILAPVADFDISVESAINRKASLEILKAKKGSEIELIIWMPLENRQKEKVQDIRPRLAWITQDHEGKKVLDAINGKIIYSADYRPASPSAAPRPQ